MQWRNPREKQLGVEMGFVIVAVGREARVSNLVFDAKDLDHNSPRQGNIRPASAAEVKMWRKLASMPVESE